MAADDERRPQRELAKLTVLEREQVAQQRRLEALERQRSDDGETLRSLRRDVDATQAKFPQNELSDVEEGHLHKRVGRLNLRTPTEIVIASGLVDMMRSEHTIDTESDAATDNLAGIRGGRAGDLLLISPDNGARTIVVQHNNTGEGTAGNRIFLDGDADLALDAIGHVLFLKYMATLDSGNGGWQEIARSNRGGYSELNNASAALDLTTSNQDVPGLSVTLPTPGTHLILITLYFDCIAAADATDGFIGALTDSGGTEETGLMGWQSDVGFEPSDVLSVTKAWRVTTTTNDEVFKARARRAGTTGVLRVQVTHSAILAFSIPGGGGGGEGADHDAVTLSGTPDYLTLNGQDIVRGQIDLTADVAGLLPEANIDSAIARDSELHAEGHNLASHATRPHSALSDAPADAHHTKYADADAVAAIESEDPLDLAGVVNFAKNLNLPHAGEVTILSGAGNIVVTGSYHTVDTINDNATDNLDIIKGPGGAEPADGQFLIVSPAHADRTIVLRHDAAATVGAIRCVGQANITLDDVEDFAILIYSALQGRWFAMSPGSTLPHGVADHTGIVGERQVEIVIPLKKALPAATNNATLDDDYLYRKPYNVARRINRWYIRFASNLAAEAIFELRKNGTVLTGSSITIAASARDAAIDSFTEVTLADGDSLEVFQTGGDAENVGGRAVIYGDEDIVAAVS